jgi:hypothetical protein
MSFKSDDINSSLKKFNPEDTDFMAMSPQDHQLEDLVLLKKPNMMLNCSNQDISHLMTPSQVVMKKKPNYSRESSA